MANDDLNRNLMPLSAGTILKNRYQIVARVGGGSLGSVYRAADLSLAHRAVAIKEMIVQFADELARDAAIADFTHECELLSRLEHPSIPEVYDYFFDAASERYYLVKKFVEGNDLGTLLHRNQGPLDESTVTTWAIQTCEVLEYLHTQNPPVIYRDLKPSNLMLDERSHHIMLVDFGIDRQASSKKNVTAAGTIGYAAPESFLNNVEPRSDLYSLGATMFCLLTGHDPQDNPLLIFDLKKNPKLRQLNPAVTEAMEGMIGCAVEYFADHRYLSARIFSRQLQAHLVALAKEKEVRQTICSSCHQDLEPGLMFCHWCGARQMPSGRTQPMVAAYLVLQENDSLSQVPLKAVGETILGRYSQARGISADINLTDPRVARRHARIIAENGEYFIEDLNSANGTMVSDSRLMPGQRVLLTEGKSIRIAEHKLTFTYSMLHASSDNIRYVIDTADLRVPASSELDPPSTDFVTPPVTAPQEPALPGAVAGAPLVATQLIAEARLIVTGMDANEAQFPVPFSGELLIGRLDPKRGVYPDVDLTTFDTVARVSRKHARLLADSGQFFIEDLQSGNGTFVNENRLTANQSYEIKDGDEIRVGFTILKFAGPISAHPSGKMPVIPKEKKSGDRPEPVVKLFNSKFETSQQATEVINHQAPVIPQQVSQPLPLLPETLEMPAISAAASTPSPRRKKRITLWERFSGALLDIITNSSGDITMPPELAASQPSATPRLAQYAEASFPLSLPAASLQTLQIKIVKPAASASTGTMAQISPKAFHDLPPSPGIAAATGTTPKPDQQLNVSLSAENFSIQGESCQQVRLPDAGQPETVRFSLWGRQPGKGVIRLDFSQNGVPVGSLDLTAEIVRGEQSSSETMNRVSCELRLPETPVTAPDAVLKVFSDHTSSPTQKLRFVLSSAHPALKDLPVQDDDLGEVELPQNSAELTELLLQHYLSQVWNRNLTAQEFSTIIAALGHQFYDLLLPPALKELCWLLRSRGVKTILILTDDPHLPWELIKPYRINGSSGAIEAEDSFWGESFAITRWLRNQTPVHKLSFNRTAALSTAASSNLLKPGRNAVAGSPATQFEPDAPPVAVRATAEELQIVRSLEAFGSRVRVLAPQRRLLLEVLTQGGFDLFHLANYLGSEPGEKAGDATVVKLTDGLFSVAELTPEISVALHQTAPLMWLHSSQPANESFRLTNAGLWAERLLNTGCGAFLGTLWPVNEEAAATFARVFYHNITTGIAIGEAIQRARLTVHQQFPNDPSWLAYCCFACPTATVQNL